MSRIFLLTVVVVALLPPAPREGRRKRDTLYDCNGHVECSEASAAAGCDYRDELVLASSAAQAVSILVSECQAQHPSRACHATTLHCYDPNNN